MAKLRQPFPHYQDRRGNCSMLAEDLWDAARAWGRANGKETCEMAVQGAPPL